MTALRVEVKLVILPVMIERNFVDEVHFTEVMNKIPLVTVEGKSPQSKQQTQRQSLVT